MRGSPSAHSRKTNSERQQIFGTGSQNFATRLRNYDRVFDAYSPFAGEINSGLNGDHHARPENFLLCGSNFGRFMDLKAQPVAR
jgi:hypothetical protein